jgi:hypothetical protein
MYAGRLCVIGKFKNKSIDSHPLLYFLEQRDCFARQGALLWGKNFQWAGMLGRIDALVWMPPDGGAIMSTGGGRLYFSMAGELKQYDVIFYSSKTLIEDRADDPVISVAARFPSAVTDLAWCGGIGGASGKGTLYGVHEEQVVHIMDGSPLNLTGMSDINAVQRILCTPATQEEGGSLLIIMTSDGRWTQAVRIKSSFKSDAVRLNATASDFNLNSDLS